MPKLNITFIYITSKNERGITTSLNTLDWEDIKHIKCKLLTQEELAQALDNPNTQN